MLTDETDATAPLHETISHNIHAGFMVCHTPEGKFFYFFLNYDNLADISAKSTVSAYQRNSAAINATVGCYQQSAQQSNNLSINH